jgi:hypothetical protein
MWVVFLSAYGLLLLAWIDSPLIGFRFRKKQTEFLEILFTYIRIKDLTPLQITRHDTS